MSRVVHFEIMSKEPEKAAKFYGQAFGWEIKSWEGETEYWIVDTGKDEMGIGGGIVRMDKLNQPVVNSVGVESLEPVIEAVEKAGGKVLQGPMEIPDMGRMAYCSDPEGIVFSLWQAQM
jgi:hypothetical protein